MKTQMKKQPTCIRNQVCECDNNEALLVRCSACRHRVDSRDDSNAVSEQRPPGQLPLLIMGGGDWYHMHTAVLQHGMEMPQYWSALVD